MYKNSAIILLLTLIFPFRAAFAQEDLLKSYVAELSSSQFQGRGRINSGYGIRTNVNEGHDAAARYIADHFAKDGLVACGADFISHFPMKDGHGDGLNVIGFFPGLGKFPVEKYIVVASHYDHLGTINGKMYPGADCNASGVAAMMAVADRLKAFRDANRYYNTSVIFVAFDCYLDGRAGSENLWNRICDGKFRDPMTGVVIHPEMISLMVDIDQIGSSIVPLHKGRPDYLIALGRDSLPRWKYFLLEDANSDSRLDLGYTYYGSANFTSTFYLLGDRRHFIKGGVPVLYFTSGITKFNNSVSDTVETLDFPVMEQRVKFICRVVEEML